jgi:hypothetical protein
MSCKSYMRFLLSVIVTLVSCLTGVAAEAPEIHALSLNSVSARSVVRPQAVFQQTVEYVVPELILGGEWTSTIRLTNRSSKSIPATNVYFVDNNGNDMKTTFQATAGNIVTDVGFSFSLPPGTILEITLFGGKDSQFGHAIVDLCSSAGTCMTGLYAEVMLRNSNPTRPDFESIFPLEQPTASQYMLFDHRSGRSTVLYLVNEEVKTTTVSLQFINTSNQVIQTQSVTLPGLGCQIITLNTLAPATNGLQGTLSIKSGSAMVTATALRINPSGSFTPIRAFVPNL